jgi:short-subunit dehydrogenase
MAYWDRKRAVVTGGSAGLGRALAGALIQHGARVIIVGRRAALLEETAAKLGAGSGQIITLAADVTHQSDVERLSATVQSAWGGIDAFFHCVGQSMRGTALDTSVDEYRQLWESNFVSTLLCAKAFAGPLAKAQGHLVLMGSLASKVAAGYLGAYPATKFPLAALAQQLRIEFGSRGPHVLLVCPGPIAREEVTPPNSTGRYADQTSNVPAIAQQPGGGARLRAIDPNWLAEQILEACQARRAELVVPRHARLLFAITQISPRLGDWLLKKMTSG